MKVLVTGGSGFIASHCVKTLLASNHTVVTTVRSAEKGEIILSSYPESSKGQLSYVVVPDIAQEGAFDKVVVSDPPFDAVLHTASPFHFQFQDPKELLDPAIHGTKGILRAIRDKAPSVSRVVITSSFAALVNPDGHPDVYSENQWNPVTYKEGIEDRAKTYRASKTLAERAAWSFMEEEKPGFSLATICPPYVFGPPIHVPESRAALNTSNTHFAMLMHGGWQEKLPPTGAWLWVDVRDIALAHVRAMEMPQAGGKRFFITAGHFDMKEVAEIAKKNFPEYADKLPAELTSDKPTPLYGFDNSRSTEILKLKYQPLETSVVDTIKFLRSHHI
ncbi:ketoreductase [Aspergillus uvarum CBS 121591]|uniref:Ketoreductase n=1 Tax=Aspergillus uvarum CBS 121591 TaxID=1448315 RepID=A0A319C8D3_9EURO|nr:ketoreductase [Aspergillus uvarum CBS 121591]PYH82076.1 ketoreductase [Aspergillus uvarum CBS 121591]